MPAGGAVSTNPPRPPWQPDRPSPPDDGRGFLFTPDLSLTDVAIAEPAPPPWPRRPARGFRVDADAVVRSVLEGVQRIIDDEERGDIMARRMNRYAKYRGWMEPGRKTSPWVGCSDVHFPMLQTAELRLNAGLHNVIMTMRPLVSAKATNPAHLEKEDRITQLLDTQLFLDPGPERAERVWSDYVSAFGQDGNAVLFTPWVREELEITEVLFRPAVPPGMDPEQHLLMIFSGLFGEAAQPESDPDTPHHYRLRYRERGHARTATVEVYQGEDDGLELVVTREVTEYDGPVALPIELDDLFIPTRCENLQPPSAWNPKGAPRVVVRTYLSLDAVRRNQTSDKYNWLDATGLAAIEAAARGLQGVDMTASDDRTEGKVQKDRFEGRDHSQPQDDESLGQVVLPFYMVFDQWAVNGPALEDVFWLIQPDAKVLCEGRRLRELWPAVRAYRPLAEAACIPVPGRWYALGLVELGESLQDLVKATFDMAFDAATLAKRPFFFFASGAKFPLDTLSLGPGDGVPVQGDPKAAVYFPTMPGGDQQWAFQVIGVAVQAFERLLMLGDLQLGRVPQGKASALRTYGTTAALLQQGDVRADQMLLRLFNGIRQVAKHFHAMNRHLLPEGTEIRRLGWDGPEAQGYLRIETLDEIDADVAFDFRPDFLLSNMDALATAIEGAIGMLATPLAFQLGITTPIKFYTALKDYFRARKLDYKHYLQPPTDTGGPPIFATEVIAAILADTLPSGTVPAEGTEAHAQALFQFMNSNEFGHLTPVQGQLFKAYLADLGQRFQREHLAKQAQAFQQQTGQMPGGKGQGQGGAGSVMAPPEMGTGAEAQGQMMPANAGG